MSVAQNFKVGKIWKQDINLSKCKISDQLLNLKLKLRGIPKPLDIIDQERLKC
jgi:hypothetical protein